MTLLYRPVLIETAEQAEALPEGTILFDGDPEHGDTYVRGGDDWHTDGYPHVLSEALRAGLNVTALVPIEADEEFSAENSYGGRDLTSSLAFAQIDAELHGTTAQTRYVTPWTTW